MVQTLNNTQLVKYLKSQLTCMFPDGISMNNLDVIVEKAMHKVEYCFSHVSLPYYSKDGAPFFNHLNADHYTVFIYYCSNIAFKQNNIDLASKLFYLNKILHSFHCMYDTQLPDIFIISHGVGTVLGKANYSNYLVVTQGCTVGANANWEYPEISEYFIMYPNSSILGKSYTDNNVILANNSMLLNRSIGKQTLITGQHPNIIEKIARKDIFSQFFR